MSKPMIAFDLDNYMDRTIEFVEEYSGELRILVRETTPTQFPTIIAIIDLSFNDISFICGFLKDYIDGAKKGVSYGT
jgi:hypothetical protein